MDPPQNGCNESIKRCQIDALLALAQQHIAVSTSLHTRSLAMLQRASKQELRHFHWLGSSCNQMSFLPKCARHYRRMGCAAIIQRLRYAG